MQQTCTALFQDAPREFSAVHFHGESRLSRIPHGQPELKVRNIRNRFRGIDPQIELPTSESIAQLAQDVAPSVHGSAAPVSRIQSRSKPLEVSAFATVNFHF